MAQYAFVSAERANHAVAMLCRVVGVSVSGFHAWLHAIPTVQVRAEAEAELRGHIGRIFAARRQVYGSPRVHVDCPEVGLSLRGRRAAVHSCRDKPLSGPQGRPPELCSRRGRERLDCCG